MDNVSKGYKAAQLDDIAGKSNKHALKSTKAIGTNQERRQAQRQIETQGKKVSNKEINKKILNEKSSAIELVNFEYEFIRYSIPIVSIPFQGVTSELTDN